MAEFNISDAAVCKLAYYVYLLVDPRDSRVFYVGKGKGARCLIHLDANGSSGKAQRIRAIRRAGHEPRIDFLAHGLKDEKTALKVESAAIDLIGLSNLTNIVRGHGVILGRQSIHDLLVKYNALPVKIDEPAILIRINKLYRSNMSSVELYDVTRGIWKIGTRSKKKPKAQFAFAVYHGIVREVYEILTWFKAGETFSTRDLSKRDLSGRQEFIGRLAHANIRNRYLSKSVAQYFKKGAQAPVHYVNCET